ncbi:MAG: nucleotidyl transferase AbiEii/AbiGii toxin family protein, partial [Anaerolineae bacterium]|nr:nucleotidyl transferase AbiEii/AbiGii toxin family protein [Anaerolineae bacterium]
MPTVDQMLREVSQINRGIPFWILEKDYALSYLLAGMATVPVLNASLVLKGGTALRKFYFSDYRFSEDLDFSSYPGMQLSHIEAVMQEAVYQMTQLLQTVGPFDAQMERLTLRGLHPGGQDAFIVRVRFPSHREPLCRLKVEITHDEIIMLPSLKRSLLHCYSELPPVAQWHCYALEEVVAEKLRAVL